MKKTVYVVCVCVLFVLLFYEVKRNYETENDGTIIVPTGSFVSKVQKENQKTAYLTFDDGPSGNTKKIIKILEEKGAVATFFLIGKEITGELENMKEKWGKKYPYAISNWENNWEDVSSFFQFSNDIRRIMYTTNIIEGLNRQYRKVTKTKSVFPSDSALEKMLYLASENVVKKWTQRYRNWDQVLNQLIVLYGERLTAYL